MRYSVGNRFQVKHLTGVVSMVEKKKLKTFGLLQTFEESADKTMLFFCDFVMMQTCTDRYSSSDSPHEVESIKYLEFDFTTLCILSLE